MKNLKPLVLTIAGLLFADGVGRAQSPYFNAVTNLNPAGYWPMHEVEQPVRGSTETNYGSLANLATGYYSDWETNNTATTRITHQYVPGAIANDSDQATFFVAPGAGGAAANQCLIAPHTSPLLTIKPPFTIEAWVFPTNTISFGVIIGEGGNAGLNGTNNLDGFQMGFGANELQMQYYTGVAGGANNHVTSAIYPTNHWYHCVVTYDGVNTHMWVNGSDAKDATDTMLPSVWSPLVVGSGKWGAGPIRNLVGVVDEVAIYTNVISDISQHYNDGVGGSAGAYVADVLADHPIVYYRMDAPAYVAPNVSTWPALTNNGTVGVNGIYTPGTIPGGVTGAAYSAFPTGLTGNNVIPFSGMSTFADAGNDASYNPTGPNAVFGISAVFRGNPTDPRVQSICGRGTNSWQIVMNTSGKIVFNAGTGMAAADGTNDLTSSKVYNDGLWHQLVATHNGSTNILYVDGVPDSTNVTTVNIAGSSNDIFIGADPSYTNNPVAIGRQFGGQICDVAFFTNLLQLSNVQTLYNVSQVPPFIRQQPKSGTAIQNTAFTNTVTAAGNATLTYQWYVNSSSSAVATSASISGQTNASLILNPVIAANATNYFVVVANNYGSVTSAVVTLAVVGVPTITSQSPLSYTTPITLFAGANPTFSISVIGTSPISYLWYTNGVADGIATNSGLSFTNVQIGSFADYCIVTNLYGSVTSMVWNVSVTAAPTAPYPTNVMAANPIGYWRLNETSDDGNGNDGAICHDYVGGNNGIYTNVYLGNAAGGTGYSPATDPTETAAFFGFFANFDSDANSIAGIDFSSPTNTSKAFTVETWAQGYGTQSAGAGLVTKGFSGGEQFCLDAGSPNNCYRFFMRDASGTVHTVTSAVPASKNYDNNIWHHLVGVCDEANGYVAFYIDGQLIGTNAIIPGSGILSSANTMTIGARMGAATGNNNNQFIGFMNDVAIYNYALSPGQIVAQYSTVPTMPFITQQPVASLTINGGASFTLSGAAFGTPPLTYEWFDVNANAYIPGQTNATLTLSNVLASDIYYLTVTNIYGTANSSPHTVVTVNNTAPVINSQLPATNLFTVFASAKPPFTIGAVGTLPLSYLWFTNNVRDGAVGNANATFLFTNPPLSGFTAYCIVTNTLGMNTSKVWTVSVIAAPTAPYPQLVLSNSPIAYWRLDEPDNGLNNSNNGVLCHDYVGGNNGDYNDAFLGQPGYNSGADSDTSAFFTNVYPSCARDIPGPDFGLPSGQNAAFSIEFWQQSPAGFNNGGTGNYVSKGGSGATQFNIDNQGAGGNYAFVIHNANNAIFGPIDGGINASDGAWHHIVGTVDENLSVSNMILYVDGVARAWATVPSGTGILPELSSPIYIGCSISQASGQTVGKIDEVAMYNYALNASQVSADYQTGLASGFIVNTHSTNIVFSVTNNQLHLSWPADHTGWRLQTETNSLLTGISTNWVDVSGSTNVNQVTIPINLTNGSVFYRMVYP